MIRAMRDLFGEVPVTWPEVFAWCEAVAGIPADSPRLALYVRTYDVCGKVARAKLAGTLEVILAPQFTSTPARLARIAQDARIGLSGYSRGLGRR